MNDNPENKTKITTRTVAALFGILITLREYIIHLVLIDMITKQYQ